MLNHARLEDMNQTKNTASTPYRLRRDNIEVTVSRVQKGGKAVERRGILSNTNTRLLEGPGVEPDHGNHGKVAWSRSEGHVGAGRLGSRGVDQGTVGQL